MIGEHKNFENWGIRPILFEIGGLRISSYSFFVLLALTVGCLVYFYEIKRAGKSDERGFLIAFGSIAGGILGAKIFQIIIDFKYIVSNFSNPEILLSGRTITGGLVGGLWGAILTKKILGINERRGNFFAPAIAIGVAVGRVGCFLQGCCFGKETSLPWGFDFGDGINRHPTQIYESLFMLGMFLYLNNKKNDNKIKPGELFKYLMMSYFIFRFLIEFIRVEKIAFYNLTVFQLIAIVVVFYFVFRDIEFKSNKFKFDYFKK